MMMMMMIIIITKTPTPRILQSDLNVDKLCGLGQVVDLSIIIPGQLS